MDPFIWVHKFSYLEQLIQICNRIASYAFVADINILPKDMRVCGDNAKEGLKKKSDYSIVFWQPQWEKN